MNLTPDTKYAFIDYNVMDEHGNIEVERYRNVTMDKSYRNGDFVVNGANGPAHIAKIAVVGYQYV